MNYVSSSYVFQLLLSLSFLLFLRLSPSPAQTQIQVLRFLKHVGRGYTFIVSHFWYTLCENWLNLSHKYAITGMRKKKFPCGPNLGPEGLIRIKVFLTLEDILNKRRVYDFCCECESRLEWSKFTHDKSICYHNCSRIAVLYRVLFCLWKIMLWTYDFIKAGGHSGVKS